MFILILELTILFNGEKYYSEHGLKDLIRKYKLNRIDFIRLFILKGDIEIALTHSKTQYSEEYHSFFVNGQNTTQRWNPSGSI
jgi:topoisomerase-4 subunit B